MVDPLAWPERQKNPAGHVLCWLFVEAAGQKYPAAQGFDVDVVLPRAMQEPEAHVAHEKGDTKALPPLENVPAGHGFAVATPVPAGQKWPGGQRLCVTFVVTLSQTYPGVHGVAASDAEPVARQKPTGHLFVAPEGAAASPAGQK